MQSDAPTHAVSVCGERTELVAAPGLSALAQVAGPFAVAFNDLLTVVIGRARLLLDAEDPSSPQRDSLVQIYNAGERAAGLVRRLLIFTGRQKANPRVLDLNLEVERLADTLRCIAGPEIGVQFQPRSGLPAIAADAGMIEQLLLELTWNARDAMPHGGKLVITTASATVGPDQIADYPGGRPGDFVILAVADTGCGIAPDLLPRVFEPFFTTRSSDRKAGLGLAAVAGIVQQHEGWLRATSALDQGTEMKIFFPAVPREAPMATAAGPQTIPGGRRETVLLVEDDIAVRELSVEVLQDCGYRVLQAASGREALEAWKWHSSRIALLVTDVVLGDDMSGLDLASKLRAGNPNLGVVFTSGHGPEIVAAAAGAPENTVFLPKPCRPQELELAVKKLVEARSAS